MSRGDLRSALEAMDGRPYPSYRSLKGEWDVGVEWNLEGATLLVDRVQADPFAPPSAMRVRLPEATNGFPEWSWTTPSRRTGLESFLVRTFRQAVSTAFDGDSRPPISMTDPGQLVLAQTAILLLPGGTIEARFRVALPARGRRILGRRGTGILCEHLPEVLRSLRFASHSEPQLRRVVETNEDAEALRHQLADAGLVGFVADGSILPRESGVSGRPLTTGDVVPFQAPETLAVTLNTPNRGAIRGLGVPSGITLIVGGGYHGKSTLLNALAEGIYNHPPGDGREYVVSRGDAVTVRAEDGRAVCGVDVSAFLSNLPSGVSTESFSTQNASGSTSQAAATVEAWEAGSRLLLIDEDTAATNFMIRDRRMRELVPPESEPITPFVARIRDLWQGHDLSTVLVVGGSGDYLDVATTVIGMNTYEPVDLGERAQQIAQDLPTHGTGVKGDLSWPPDDRRISAPTWTAKGRHRTPRVAAVDGGVKIGDEAIDLTALPQVVLASQRETIGRWLLQVQQQLEAGASMADLFDNLTRTLSDAGALTELSNGSGGLTAARTMDVLRALHRTRSLSAE